MGKRKEALGDSVAPKLFFIFPRKLNLWYDHLNQQFPGCMENVRSVKYLLYV